MIKLSLLAASVLSMAAQPVLAQPLPVQSETSQRVPSQAAPAQSHPGGNALVRQTVQAGSVANLTDPTAGVTYFHRAGSTIDQHDAAVRACGVQAGRMVLPADSGAAAAGAAGGLLGALVVGVVSGYIQAKRQTRAVVANIENCMVVDGWAVRRVSAEEGETLDELEQPALREILALRVGAQPPRDELARVFGDELTTQRPVIAGWPGDMDTVPLSIQGLPPLEKAEAAPRVRLPRQERSARPPRALAEMALAVTPDRALVIVRLDGMAEQGGETLTFVRLGEDPATPAWVADQKPDRFTVALTTRAPTRGDPTRSTTAAFAVPAGRWRLATISSGIFSLGVCRGGPAFDAVAGRAVFAGAFNLAESRITPNPVLTPTSLTPAYAALNPEAATWIPIDPVPCEGTYLYGSRPVTVAETADAAAIKAAAKVEAEATASEEAPRQALL